MRRRGRISDRRLGALRYESSTDDCFGTMIVYDDDTGVAMGEARRGYVQDGGTNKEGMEMG